MVKVIVGLKMDQENLSITETHGEHVICFFLVQLFLGFLERAVKYFHWFRRKVLYSALHGEVTDSQIELEKFLDCL